mgnify:CR=1 FL=1
MNTSYKSSDHVVVLVEGSCSVAVRNYVNYDVDIVTIPSRRIMVGNQPLWELRALKDVAIPNGIEKIGDRWFAGSSVESVRVPVSELVQILPEKSTMVGKTLLQDLR